MLQNSFERNEASLRCFDCCRSRRRSSRSTQEGWYRPSSGGGGMPSVRRWYTLAMFPLPPSPSYRKVNSEYGVMMAISFRYRKSFAR